MCTRGAGGTDQEGVAGDPSCSDLARCSVLTDGSPWFGYVCEWMILLTLCVCVCVGVEVVGPTKTMLFGDRNRSCSGLARCKSVLTGGSTWFGYVCERMIVLTLFVCEGVELVGQTKRVLFGDRDHGVLTLLGAAC